MICDWGIFFILVTLDLCLLLIHHELWNSQKWHNILIYFFFYKEILYCENIHDSQSITYEYHDNAPRMWKVVQLEKYFDFSLLSLTSLLSAPEREVTSPSDFKEGEPCDNDN
jgi:hypothetical protein